MVQIFKARDEGVCWGVALGSCVQVLVVVISDVFGTYIGRHLTSLSLLNLWDIIFNLHMLSPLGLYFT